MNPRVHKARLVLSVLGSMDFTCWLFELLAKRKNSRRVYDEEDSIHEQVEENNQRNNEGIESTSPVNVTSNTVLLICEFKEGTSWNDINLDQNSGKWHIIDVIETCGLKKARKAIMQSSSNSGAKKATTSMKMQSWSDVLTEEFNLLFSTCNLGFETKKRRFFKVLATHTHLLDAMRSSLLIISAFDEKLKGSHDKLVHEILSAPVHSFYRQIIIEIHEFSGALTDYNWERNHHSFPNPQEVPSPFTVTV